MRTTEQESQKGDWAGKPCFGPAEQRRTAKTRRWRGTSQPCRLPAGSDDLTNQTRDAVLPLPQGSVAGSRPKTLKCAQAIIKAAATVNPSLLGDDLHFAS